MAPRMTVTEFSSMPMVAGGVAPIPVLPAIASSTLDVATRQIWTLNANTKYVRVLSEGRASIAAGANAATTDMVVVANMPECFGVVGGSQISGITNP